MTTIWRDSHGKRLEDYPRPSVAVDTAVLTVAAAALCVLEVRRPATRGWALPGTFLHEGERLIDAVLRSLRDKAGVDGLRPRQLNVFDEPGRDDRGWVLSVAHVDVVAGERLANRLAERTRIIPVERAGRLPYGHGHVIAAAVDDLRARYRVTPDPAGLLGDRFTLRELRAVHEAVAGHPLQRDTFRRAMEAGLAATGHSVTRGRGRPAEIYTHASATDGSRK